MCQHWCGIGGEDSLVLFGLGSAACYSQPLVLQLCDVALVSPLGCLRNDFPMVNGSLVARWCHFELPCVVMARSMKARGRPKH
jgi:hypothetical protein